MNKKLLINASNIKVGGGLQASISIIHDMLEDSRGHQIYFIVSSNVYSQLEIPKSYKERVIILDLEPFNLKSFLSSRKFLSKFERDYEIDVVFTIFGPSFWMPKKAKHLIGFANAWLVSDDDPAYHIYPFFSRVIVRVKNYLLSNILYNKNCFYVTESESVKNKFIEKFNHENIAVVNNTCSQVYDKPVEYEETLQSISCFKFVTISHNYPHKNLKIIESVGCKLKSLGYDFMFIVTFPEEEYEKQTDLFKSLTYNMGVISLNDCPKIYKSCDALFLPTLIECFTVSYLEAMKLDMPILTSDLPFAHDVCNQSAFYFNPYDSEDVTSVLSMVLDDNLNGNNLITRKKDRYKKLLEKFGSNKKRVSSYFDLIDGL